MLVEGLVASVCEQQCRPVSVSQRSQTGTFQQDLQVNNNVRIDVTLDAVVTILGDLVPNLSFPDLGAQGSPLLVSKGILALLGFQLDDGIEDGQIQAPDLDACCP